MGKFVRDFVALVGCSIWFLLLLCLCRSENRNKHIVTFNSQGKSSVDSSCVLASLVLVLVLFCLAFLCFVFVSHLWYWQWNPEFHAYYSRLSVSELSLSPPWYSLKLCLCLPCQAPKLPGSPQSGHRDPISLDTQNHPCKSSVQMQATQHTMFQEGEKDIPSYQSSSETVSVVHFVVPGLGVAIGSLREQPLSAIRHSQLHSIKSDSPPPKHSINHFSA